MAAARSDDDGDYMLCDYEQIYAAVRSLRSGAPVISSAELEKILQVRREVFSNAQFAGPKNEKKRHHVLHDDVSKLAISGKAKGNLKSWSPELLRSLQQESIKLSDLLNLDESACLDLLAFAENALGGTSTSDKQQFGSETRLFCAALFAIRVQKFVVDSIRILFELRRLGNASLVDESVDRELDEALLTTICKQTDELVGRALIANVLARLDESGALERRLERDSALFSTESTSTNRHGEKRGRTELLVAVRGLRDSLSEIIAACAFERKLDFANVRGIYARLVQATPGAQTSEPTNHEDSDAFEPLDYATMNLLFALLRGVRYIDADDEDEPYFEAAQSDSRQRFRLFDSVSNIADFHKTLIDTHWDWPRARRDLRTFVQFHFALQLAGYVQQTEKPSDSTRSTAESQRTELFKQLTNASNELFDIAVREHALFRKLALRLGLVRSATRASASESGVATATTSAAANTPEFDLPRSTVSLLASGFLVREFDTFVRDTFMRAGNMLRRHSTFDERSGEHDPCAALVELLELVAAFYRRAPSSIVDRVWTRTGATRLDVDVRIYGRLIDRVEATVFGEEPQLATPIGVELLVAFVRFLGGAASTPSGAAHCYARLASPSHPAAATSGVMSIGRFFTALGHYASDLHSLANDPNVTAPAGVSGEPTSPFSSSRPSGSPFVPPRKRISPRELEALVAYATLVQQLAARNEQVRVLLSREQDAVRACCALLAAGCLPHSSLPLALRTALCRMLAALSRDRFDIARFVLQTIAQPDTELDSRFNRLLFVDDDASWASSNRMSDAADGTTPEAADEPLYGDLFEFEPESEFESTRSASTLSAARAFVTLLEALAGAYCLENASRSNERSIALGSSMNGSFDASGRAANTDLMSVADQLGKMVDYAVRCVLPRAANVACCSPQFASARSRTARVLERERERAWLVTSQLFALLRSLLDPFVVDSRALLVAFVSRTRSSDLGLHALVHFLVDEPTSYAGALRVALTTLDAAANCLFSGSPSCPLRAVVTCAFETIALLALVAAKQARFFDSLRQVLAIDSPEVRTSVLHTVRFEPIERGFVLFSGATSDGTSATRVDSFLNVARFAHLAFDADATTSSAAVAIGEADRVALAFVAVDLLARCAARFTAAQHAELTACIWQRSAADRSALVASVCDCIAQLGVSENDSDDDDLIDEDTFISRLPRSLGAASLTGSRCALLFELVSPRRAEQSVAKRSLYTRVRERTLELLLVSLAAGRGRSSTLLSSTVADFVLFGASTQSVPASSTLSATHTDVLLAVVAFLLRSAVRFLELVERLSDASLKHAALPSAAAHDLTELGGALNDLAQFVERNATAFELACRLLPAAFTAESQSTLHGCVATQAGTAQLRRSSCSRLATLIDELVVRWLNAAARCATTLNDNDALASRAELVDEGRINVVRHALTACFAQLLRVAGARLCGTAAVSADRSLVKSMFGGVSIEGEPLLLVTLTNLINNDRLITEAHSNSAWLRENLRRLNVAVVEQTVFSDETLGESEATAKLIGIVESPPLLRIEAIESVLANELGLQNADLSRSRPVEELSISERDRDDLLREVNTVLRVAANRNRLRTAAYAYGDALESVGELLHFVNTSQHRPVPTTAAYRRFVDRVAIWTFEQLAITLSNGDSTRPLSLTGSHRLITSLARLGFDTVAQLSNATLSCRLLERMRGEPSSRGASASAIAASSDEAEQAVFEKRNSSLINLLHLVTVCLLKASDNDTQLPGSIRVLVSGSLLTLIELVHAGMQPRFPGDVGLGSTAYAALRSDFAPSRSGVATFDLLSRNTDAEAETECVMLQRAVAAILEQPIVESSAGEPPVPIGAALFNAALAETIDGSSPLARTSGAQLLALLFDAVVVRSSASWLAGAQRSNLVRCLVDALADASRSLVRVSDVLLSHDSDAASPDEIDALLRAATALRCLFAALARIARSSTVGASCLLANGTLQTLAELTTFDRLEEAAERSDPLGSLVANQFETVRRGAFRLVASLGHAATQTGGTTPSAFRLFLSAHVDTLILRSQRFEQALGSGCTLTSDDASPLARVEPSTFDSLFEFADAMRASLTAACCLPDSDGRRMASEQPRIASLTRHFLSLLGVATGLIRRLAEPTGSDLLNGARHAELVSDCVPLSLGTLQRAFRATLSGEESQCERTVVRCCMPAASSRFGNEGLLASAFEQHASYLLVSSVSCMLQLLVALGSTRTATDAEVDGSTLESLVSAASFFSDRVPDAADSRRLGLSVFVSLLDACATLHDALTAQLGATIERAQTVPVDMIDALFDSAIGAGDWTNRREVSSNTQKSAASSGIEKQAGALLSIGEKQAALRFRTAFKLDCILPLMRMLPTVVEQVLTVIYLRVSAALNELGVASGGRIDAAEREQIAAQRRDRLRSELRALVESALFERIAAIANDAQMRSTEDGQSSGVRLTDALLSRFRVLAHSG